MANDNLWRISALGLRHIIGESPRKYLDIGLEGVLLKESQDVAEELKIMKHIFHEQLMTVKQLRRYLTQMTHSAAPESDDQSLSRMVSVLERQCQTDSSTQNVPKYSRTSQDLDAIHGVDILLGDIRNRIDEIRHLEDSVIEIGHQVRLPKDRRSLFVNTVLRLSVFSQPNNKC